MNTNKNESFATGMCSVFLCLLCVPWAVMAAPLVRCPDCEKPVSPRAVFCPACGCPEEAIIEVAKSPDSAVPREPDRLLRIDADGQRGFAFPVEMADGLYAVAPLEFLLAKDTLALSFFSTNAPVSYDAVEVATGAALVRLRLAETNLAYWCAAPERNEPAATLDVSMVGGMAFGREITVRTLAQVSAATNLTAILSAVNGTPEAQRLSAVTWLPVRPKAFREQSRAFLRLVSGDAEAKPEKWCHPIFEFLLQSRSQKEK